jgi:hypothetical protein
MFDPEVLQILGLNLMAGKSPNFAENLGNAGLATMQYQRQREEDKYRKEEREFLKQQREMQMAQLKREQQFKDALSQGFRPGIGADPLTPMDDEGNPMPSSKPTMDFSRAMQIDPFAAMQAQAQFQSFNKPQTFKLGKGEAVFGADGRRLFDNPDPVKPPPLPTGFELGPDGQMRVNPAYAQFMLEKQRAGASRVSVNNPQESAFNKEHGKNLAETYSNLIKSDTAATAKLNNLRRLEDLLRNSGNTGSLKPTLTSLQAIGKQLGIDISDKTDFAQAAQALSNQMALELRNPAGGAGMPGALSDKDREFLVGMTAGIDKLPQANRLIIETQRRLAQRERDIARLAREYRKTNGNFDDGFYDLLEQYAASKPLFDDLAPALSSGQSASGVVPFSALPSGR